MDISLLFGAGGGLACGPSPNPRPASGACSGLHGGRRLLIEAAAAQEYRIACRTVCRGWLPWLCGDFTSYLHSPLSRPAGGFDACLGASRGRRLGRGTSGG